MRHTHVRGAALQFACDSVCACNLCPCARVVANLPWRSDELLLLCGLILAAARLRLLFSRYSTRLSRYFTRTSYASAACSRLYHCSAQPANLTLARLRKGHQLGLGSRSMRLPAASWLAQLPEGSTPTPSAGASFRIDRIHGTDVVDP